MASLAKHYQRPDGFTTNVFNRLAAALTRLGVSVYELRARRGRVVSWSGGSTSATKR